MLTESQAKEIVRGSIQKVVKGSPETDKSTLRELGLTPDKIQQLAITIVSDSQTGVVRLQHYLDPNQLATLLPDTTVAALTEKVRFLSVGKLCSNPTSPHEQECCPYPAFCPECGFPVR